jgi:hypothetical protein
LKSRPLLKLPDINLSIHLDSRGGVFFVLALLCVASAIAEIAFSYVQSHWMHIEPWPRVAGGMFWVFFAFSVLVGAWIFVDDQ